MKSTNDYPLQNHPPQSHYGQSYTGNEIYANMGANLTNGTPPTKHQSSSNSRSISSNIQPTPSHSIQGGMPANFLTPNLLQASPNSPQQHQGQYLHPYLTIDPILLNPGVSLAASSLIDWPNLTAQAAAAVAAQNCCSYLGASTSQGQNLLISKGYLSNEDVLIPSLMGVPNGTSLLKEEGISPPPGQKIDTSQHYHIFVGDLSPEIDAYKLRDAFSSFGFVTECKIIKDMHTHKPKGYGFVAYATYEEAELAKIKMNGQTLGSRSIRTNWAVRKPPTQNGRDQKPLNYEEVSSASSPTNSTIYIGAVPKALEEDILTEFFKDFGKIQEIRIFKEKGYAFVRFESHELATKSIITMHGGELCGSPVKVSWGKETGEEKDIIQQLPNPTATQSLSASTTSLNSFIRPEMVFNGQLPTSNQSTSLALTAAAVLGGTNVQLSNNFYQGPHPSTGHHHPQNPLNLLAQMNPGHLNGKPISTSSNAFLNII